MGKGISCADYLFFCADYLVGWRNCSTFVSVIKSVS